MKELIDILQFYKIDYDNIVSINSDSAPYMELFILNFKKSFCPQVIYFK